MAPKIMKRPSSAAIEGEKKEKVAKTDPKRWQKATKLPSDTKAVGMDALALINADEPMGKNTAQTIMDRLKALKKKTKTTRVWKTTKPSKQTKKKRCLG